MNEIGRVAELWRYPVSSLGGEPLPALSADGDGVDGDRLFGLVETSTGGLAAPQSDRRWHNVPRIRARLSEGRALEVATPDGGWLAAAANESDRAGAA